MTPRRIGIAAVLAAIVTTVCIVAGKSCRTEAPEPVEGVNGWITNALSDTSDLAGLDRKVRTYMQEWQLKGLSLSIMRGDSLLYAKGYGWADEEAQEKMEPYHLLRIASISKLITATGIMVLQDRGVISLRDTVFGPSGILTQYNGVIRDRNYYKITVEDLLRHKAGFTVRGGDPMFSTRTIMRVNHLDTPPDNEQLAKIVLARRLSYVPGTSQAYSNFGYVLLSQVIEKVSGQSYEDFIQENVLRPAGCMDFHIAGNYLSDRREREVHYYVPVNEPPVPEFNCSADSVVRCYGGNNITALSGAGAWMASAPEVARFVAAIDGKGVLGDVISSSAVDEMVEYFDKETYSLGWNDTEPSSGWMRSGTFSGTSALVKYYPDGECWVLITNTSTWKGPGLSRYTAGLFRSLRESYSDKLPARNLFEKQ